MIDDFYSKMLDTAEEAGLPILSEDFCCKLLAWLYAFGGANEAVVKNPKLTSEILYAQKRLNINGGEIPKSGKLRPYLLVIEPYMKIPNAFEYGFLMPVWVSEIFKRYSLKTPF